MQLHGIVCSVYRTLLQRILSQLDFWGPDYVAAEILCHRNPSACNRARSYRERIDKLKEVQRKLLVSIAENCT